MLGLLSCFLLLLGFGFGNIDCMLLSCLLGLLADILKCFHTLRKWTILSSLDLFENLGWTLLELLLELFANFFVWNCGFFVVNTELHLTLFEAHVEIRNIKTEALQLWEVHSVDECIDLTWHFFEHFLTLLKLDIQH